MPLHVPFPARDDAPPAPKTGQNAPQPADDEDELPDLPTLTRVATYPVTAPVVVREDKARLEVQSQRRMDQLARRQSEQVAKELHSLSRRQELDARISDVRTFEQWRSDAFRAAAEKREQERVELYRSARDRVAQSEEKHQKQIDQLAHEIASREEMVERNRQSKLTSHQREFERKKEQFASVRERWREETRRQEEERERVLRERNEEHASMLETRGANQVTFTRHHTVTYSLSGLSGTQP